FQMNDAPGDPRPISFTIRVRSNTLASFLRHPVAEIEGEVDVEQFADHKYLRGTLGLDLLRTKTLPYAFEFTANDGLRYVFEGMKTLARGALVESMTVLPAVVRDAEGKEIARALLRFDLRSDL